VLLASSVGYVVLNPSGAALEPLATETPTATARPTYTPSPTATPGAVTLDLDGTLTWQTANDGLRSVDFPTGAPVAPPADEYQEWSASDDGVWKYQMLCRDDGTGCEISFWSSDGRQRALAERYDGPDLRWRPGTHTIGISSQNAIVVIDLDDPSDAQPWVAYDAGAGTISAFEWYSDIGLLLVAYEANHATQLQLVSLNGSIRPIADIPQPIYYLHASPDGHTYAFTLRNDGGWRLMTVDALTETVTDHGAMGSDGPDGLPVPDPPDNGKGPMYIAWSPDGSKLAFGGGFEPPYIMTTVDVPSNSVARTEFPSGYPGEIKWSPDGASIAVSTYDINRTHHETWVVEPSTGAGRHLMDGCVIVWSPDSRFLAVHGEDRPGIAIIDAASGVRMQLTSDPADVPISWTTD
jgi:hypothetical protein